MKAKVKVKGIEQRDGYYRVRYCYADLMCGDMPVTYSLKEYGATDEMDAYMRFMRQMDEVNYEVITNE